MPDELIFFAVTTESKSRRHWSGPPHGRYGYATICSGLRAMDQAQLVDAMPRRWRKRTVITDLPPCKSCDKIRQSRIDGRTP